MSSAITHHSLALPPDLASNANRPGPAMNKVKNPAKYINASSPLPGPFRTSLCTEKKATAIVIEQLSAANRLNNPRISKIVPTTSPKVARARLPFMPIPKGSANFPDISPKLLSFVHPCKVSSDNPNHSRNSNSAKSALAGTKSSRSNRPKILMGGQPTEATEKPQLFRAGSSQPVGDVFKEC